MLPLLLLLLCLLLCLLLLVCLLLLCLLLLRLLLCLLLLLLLLLCCGCCRCCDCRGVKGLSVLCFLQVFGFDKPLDASTSDNPREFAVEAHCRDVFALADSCAAVEHHVRISRVRCNFAQFRLVPAICAVNASQPFRLADCSNRRDFRASL